MKSVSEAHFYYWDKALTDEDCDMIIHEGLALNNFKQAGVNKDNLPDPELRQGSIAWFPKESPIDFLCKTYVGRANNEANWNYIINDSEQVQFSIYGLQSKYGWHRDTNVEMPEGTPVRKLSISVQLSHPDDYENGDFQIKNFYGNELTEHKESLRNRGTVIVFPSFLEHQVTPVTKGTRYSLVQWYRGPDWR